MFEQIAANAQLFFLIFARVFGLIRIAPLLSSTAIPSTVRTGLAFFVAAVVFPWVSADGYPIPENGTLYALLLAGELMVGIVIGFFLLLVFSAFQLAGQFFSLQMGFGASEVFDPLSQVEIPVVGQFLNLIAMFIFIVIQGFSRIFLTGVYRSFQAMRAVDLVIRPERLLRAVFRKSGPALRGGADHLLSHPGHDIPGHDLGRTARESGTPDEPARAGIPHLDRRRLHDDPGDPSVHRRSVRADHRHRIHRPAGTAGRDMEEARMILLSEDARRRIVLAVSTAERSAFADVHLQWFAPEDEGRTEAPTEHKIRKAREEGKVARTAELAGSLVLLFPVLTIAALSTYLLRTMVEMVRFYFQFAEAPGSIPNSQLFAAFGTYFLRLTWPVFTTAFIAALFGNLVQVGFLFTTKPITPDFSRIVPHVGRFFARAFFSVEAIFNLVKSLLKVTVIGLLAYVNIMAEIGRLSNLTRVSYLASVGLIAAITFRLLVESAIIFFVLSLFDYLFQRWQHRRSLMMSRQEIKEERKIYEGDPLVKSRLRERMREIHDQEPAAAGTPGGRGNHEPDPLRGGPGMEAGEDVGTPAHRQRTGSRRGADPRAGPGERRADRGEQAARSGALCRAGNR